VITSTDNPRVKAYARLKNGRERRRTGLFLIEGHREVARAQQAGVDIETLLLCPTLLGDEDVETGGAEIVEVAEAPMRRVAIREHPPGAIAVAHQFSTNLDDVTIGGNPLVLIAERVEKPGNLGAMMRTCDAVGASAFIAADAATDLFNPNVVRASQGALFSITVAAAPAADVIDWCRDGNISVTGGYPDAATELWEADLSGPAAVLVGAEDSGISPMWAEVASAVSIPMAGAADSLNASVSAALLLYEAVRQRRS
jgi:TrmH family RNA methyltransferase